MLKKIIYILLGLVALIFVSAIVIPIIFKDKIVAKVKDEINNNVNAKVDFGSFDISIFKHFPYLSFSLNDLSVVGINDFEGDTLTSVKSFDIGVNLWSVITGDQISIRTINLNKPYINIIVLENGKANYDIAKVDTSAAAPSEPSSFKMKLQKYTINNGLVQYDDRSLAFRMELADLNHTGSGDFTQDLFILDTKTDIEQTSLWYGGVKYLNDIKTYIKAALDMDMKNFKFTFKENEVKLNELAFGIDGWLALADENMDMDLTFDAKKNEFRHFISMIPGVYREGFKDLKSSGTLALDGFVKGRYNEKQMPGFGISVMIQNGMFQYPDLPTAVNNVNVDLNIKNPDGIPDNTVIDLKKLHAEMGAEPFDAKLMVKTPVTDAQIDAMMKGRIDFANLSKIVPLENGTSISGSLMADMTAKGRMSAVEQKRYEDFNASGTIKLSNFNYVSNEYKDGIKINTCELSFNPKNIALNNFDLKTGATDLKANGTLDNLLGYYFKNDLLKGYLNLSSTQIDLNPFMSASATASTEATPASDSQTKPLEIPTNIDFVMTATVGKILYENLVLQNVKGNISMRESVLGMNDVGFNMMDGSVVMNGLYNTKKPESPEINFDLAVQRMDVKQTFQNFVTVQKLAPIAGKCSGKYSAFFNITGKLNERMNPVYETFAGGGKLQTHGVTVDNFEPLVKIADALKMDQFKKAALSDANLSFKISNGRVYVDPYEQSIAGIKTRIEGSNGLDQTIDYKWGMQIPVKSLPPAAGNVVKDLFAKANTTAGTNLSMGENVNVNLKITGTVTNPKVETGLKDAAKGAVDDLKAKAKEELEKKKQELEDRAKATADSMKRKAEEKTKAEADRIKKEAEQKAKAEADRLKKEAEEKAKKEIGNKMKDLFGKPK